MSKQNKSSKKLRNYILKQEKKGRAVLMTFDGLKLVDIDDLINQPAEGLLWDMNRDKATVMKHMEDLKWVNDYAVALVIEKLKAIKDR